MAASDLWLKFRRALLIPLPDITSFEVSDQHLRDLLAFLETLPEEGMDVRNTVLPTN